MPSRIARKFAYLKEQSRSALITFIMGFDPDYQSSKTILDNLPDAGADIIEIGIPFSDPMADGKSIQKAGLRALKAGAKLHLILEMVKDFRKKDQDTPIILMGYYNPIHNYGLEKFISDAKSADVDGFIIVDLPIEEDNEIYELALKNDLALIKLITPTTDEKRLREILRKAQGFLYYVSVLGVTGTKSAEISSIKKSLDMIRRHSNLPIAVGFGIKSPESVAQISSIADAVVVGSSLVDKVANPAEALSFVKKLAGAL